MWGRKNKKSYADTRCGVCNGAGIDPQTDEICSGCGGSGWLRIYSADWTQLEMDLRDGDDLVQGELGL